ESRFLLAGHATALSFAPLVTAGNSDHLAVGQTRDGRDFAVVADQQDDQLRLYFRDRSTNQFGSPIVIGSQDVPLLEPCAVQLADLNRDGTTRPYLIVTEQLGNDVLVYPQVADGQFGKPARYLVDVTPVAVTVVNGVNKSGVPDLAVANEGSND